MTLTKEMLQKLRVQFAALQNLQKTNKQIIACLPKEAKASITKAQKILASAAPPTPKEIKEYLDAKIKSVITKVNTITDLFELKKLEITEYGTLSAYYNSYSKYLEEADSSYYGKRVKDCKALIDMLENELNTNPDDNASFIAEIEQMIEELDQEIPGAETLEEGDALKDKFKALKNKFDSNTENAMSISAAWIKEINKQLDDLNTKISTKRVALSEDVTDETNTCKSIVLNWVIKKHKRNVEKKEAKIDKSILKISEILKQKYTFGKEEQPSKNQERRKKRLVKKLEKLKIKETIQAADNTKVSDTEPMDITVVFCKKQLVPTGSDKGPVTYWGISEVKVPADRQTENDGGLGYTFSSEISSKGFSDMAVVSVDFIRAEATQYTFNWENLFGAIADFIPTDPIDINWAENIATLFRTIPNIVEEANVPSQDSRMQWTLSMDTDPYTLSDVNLNLTPKDDFKTFGELEYKRIETFGTHISFEGNLEEANADFIKKAKERLKLK